MTIVELVERERARLRRMHVLVGLALAIGATCLLIAVGASTLGGARWMSLPRPVPFLVWLLVLAANVAVILWTARRLERRTARNTVAAAIEREQSMRAGSVRGAMEVADSAALGRLAATAVGARWLRPPINSRRSSNGPRSAARCGPEARRRWRSPRSRSPRRIQRWPARDSQTRERVAGHAAAAHRLQQPAARSAARRNASLQSRRPARRLSRCRSACRAKRGRRSPLPVDPRTGVATTRGRPASRRLANRCDRMAARRATPRRCA